MFSEAEFYNLVIGYFACVSACFVSCLTSAKVKIAMHFCCVFAAADLPYSSNLESVIT